MRADDDRNLDPIPRSPIPAPLIWLGGGDEAEIHERHERATYAVSGVIVLAGAVLIGLTAAAAVESCTGWPLPVVLAAALFCGVLAGAVSRAIASGPIRGWRSKAVRGAVALGVGVVVGELAALVLFAGSIDRQAEQLVARAAASAPAVTQASATLDRARGARVALDDAVDRARQNLDDALVVARCEYHPTPACPQTRITGVPGAGPETRTAKDLLADAHRELDRAITLRDRRAPELDGAVDTASQTLTGAHQTAVSATHTGPGGRWLAMNDYTGAHPGALALRLAMIGLFTLLTLLPAVFKLCRGEDGQDRRATARAEIEHAELRAATAAAIRRAELRAEAEILWAEQQLASARVAIAAQTEIDETQQRRRVAEALSGPVAVTSQRGPAAGEDDMYLPIEAEAAAAASRAAAQLPAADPPAPARPGNAVQRLTALPSLPDIARGAARWVRPLVPPLVARAIDSTIRPIQAVHQVFEEVEEVTFTVKRTRKVNVGSVTTTHEPPPGAAGGHADRQPVGRLLADDSAAVVTASGPPALPAGDRPALPAGDPPALPPG